MKKDYTAKPETWENMGGVYCFNCLHFIPKSLFSMIDYCLKFGYDQTVREGSVMTGCNRGKPIDADKYLISGLH